MPLLGGLLGGLGGGLMRGGVGRSLGGGGALRGLLNNRQQKQGSGGPSQPQPQASKDAPMDPAPEEQGGQQKPEEQPQQQQTQPQQTPATNTMADEIAEAQPKQPETPLQGLLDDAPAAPEPPKTPDEPPPPQTVVNATETATPVARPVDEQFGRVPEIEPAEILRNQLMDSGSNKQPFDFQEGLPSRKPNVEGTMGNVSQGFQYTGPQGVDGALPPRRYR